MARHRHTLAQPTIIFLLFSILHLLGAPLHAQEPAALAQSRTAEIRKLLGEGRSADAISPAQALIDLLERHPGLGTTDHAITLNELALALYYARSYDRAAPLYRKALDLLRQVGDLETTANLAVVLENYAFLLIIDEDFTAAGSHLLEALRLRNELFDGAHPDYSWYITGLHNLTLHLQERGEYDMAESILREIIESKRMVLGPSDPGYAVALNNLGNFLYTRTDYDAAEALFREAREIFRSALATDQLDYLNITANLALLLQTRGDLDGAESLQREILAARHRIQGPEHPDYVLALNNLAQLLSRRGKYTEAERLYQEALQLSPDLPGLALSHHLTILSNYALLLLNRGETAAAEPILREVLEIGRDSLGTEHPDYANSLVHMADLLRRKGDYQAATSLYLEALAIWRRADQTGSEFFLETFSRLGLILQELGKLPDAEALLREGLELRRRIQGPAHPHYARGLILLGNLLVAQANFTEAEQLFQEALEIRRRVFGTEHPEYFDAMRAIATLLREKGEYSAAEPIQRTLLGEIRRVLGSKHSSYATALNELALLLHDKGDFAGAEPLYREALEIWRINPDMDQLNYTATLGNLALLLRAIGNFSAAEPLFHEALEVTGRLLGHGHPSYALALNNLAHFHVGRAEYDAAEPLFRAAVEIFAATLGTDHSHYATTIGNFALVLRHRGEYEEALATLRAALEITHRTFGREHPAYFRGLSNLALLLSDMGDFAAAESLYHEAMRIGQLSLGPRHPEIASLLSNLAGLNQQVGRPDSALAYMQRVLEIEQELLAQVFGFTSEQGMLAYANDVRTSLYGLLNIVDLHPTDAAIEAALRWVLLRKGIVLSALSSFRQIESAAAIDPEIAATLSHLHDTRRQVASMALSPPAGVAPDSLVRIMAALNGRRETLEVGLSRSLAARLKGNFLEGLRDPLDSTSSLDELRRALPRAGALIEFIRYYKVDIDKSDPSHRPATRHYAALILRPTGPVRWVSLGEADEIENAIRDLRTAHMGCESGERSHFCSEGSYRAAAEEAYLRIFDPLEPYLDGADHLIVSPDGELNQVPLGALVDLDGHYLIERFRIAYVSSGRDLIRPAPGSVKGAGTTVFAGPTFDLVPSTQTDGTRGGAATVDSAAAPGDAVPAAPRASDIPDALRSLKWDELPGALAEADDARAAFEGTEYGPVTTYTAAAATEDVLKAIHNPRILLLATHGFFIPERDLTPEERAVCLTAVSGSEQQFDLETGMGRGIERLRCAENPLLRSGIVLAGANAIGATGAAMADAATTPIVPVEDGWVLAEEIAALDLAGTELVILSACETGLGDVKTGEGVYGLRRAFQLAGAENILMSLFKVPDTATRELLNGFFLRLAAGVNAEDALRESQLELRDRYPHPFYWASFILVGQPILDR